MNWNNRQRTQGDVYRIFVYNVAPTRTMNRLVSFAPTSRMVKSLALLLVYVVTWPKRWHATKLLPPGVRTMVKSPLPK